MEQIIKSASCGIFKSSSVYSHFEKRRARLVRRSRGNIADIGCCSRNSDDLAVFGRLAARTMGKHHRSSGKHFIMHCDREDFRKRGCFVKDCFGDATVEATILFPIMILVFAALALLAVYLPAQAALQRATQYTATAIATENSDTWLRFNDASKSYEWYTHKNQLTNVYANLLSESGDVQSKAEELVTYIEGRSLSSKAGELSVVGETVNHVIYKEIVVTATRNIPMVVNLSFIGFPQTISITSVSRAVVQNGDEFVRNIDMAGGFVDFIKERYDLGNVTDAIGDFGNQVRSILGW